MEESRIIKIFIVVCMHKSRLKCTSPPFFPVSVWRCANLVSGNSLDFHMNYKNLDCRVVVVLLVGGGGGSEYFCEPSCGQWSDNNCSLFPWKFYKKSFFQPCFCFLYFVGKCTVFILHAETKPSRLGSDCLTSTMAPASGKFSISIARYGIGFVRLKAWVRMTLFMVNCAFYIIQTWSRRRLETSFIFITYFV